jgi:NAD+ diphosphatase
MVNASSEPREVVRFCPRCGAQELETRGSYGFYCQSCAFPFYFNVAAAVAGIIEAPDGRVLLTRRAHDPARGTLDIPGGFVDWNETAEEALRRELHEELGLGVAEMAYFCTVPNLYEYQGFNYRTLDVYFSVKAADLSSVRPADDVDGYELVDLQTLDPGRIGFASVREALGRWAHQR